jgi:hypothetical protein
VTKKQYPLRIDEGLWAELVRWSADELRSVNAQIEFLLRQAVAQRMRRAASPGSRPADPGIGREGEP